MMLLRNVKFTKITKYMFFNTNIFNVNMKKTTIQNHYNVDTFYASFHRIYIANNCFLLRCIATPTKKSS